MQKFKISLEAARVNAKMTQEEAAKALGISAKTIYNWETGATCPTMKQVQKLSELYNCPFNMLSLA